MNTSHAEQGSEAWRAERAGAITGSRFSEVLGTKQARLRLARQLVFERLSTKPAHEVSSKSLTWGTEVESFARDAYELETGNIVTRCGFIRHARYPFIGASPDGLVNHDGIIEMKCPHDEAVHIATWLEGMPDEHIPQVQGELFVTGRAWADFISYDPRQAEPYRLYVQRVPRDDKYIATLSGALLTFEQEVQAMLEQIQAKAAQQQGATA